MGRLQIAAYAVLMICWAAWWLAFVKPRKSAAGKTKAVRAPASRVGIFLVMLGYACEFAFVRPAEFGGLHVPEVLLNGDHLQIRKWRREQQLRKTMANRPDLLEHAALNAEDRLILDSIRNSGE